MAAGISYREPNTEEERRLWKWASVSIGTLLLGNTEGRSFSRAFERREKFLHVRKFL
jgi:hypothetical protein